MNGTESPVGARCPACKIERTDYEGPDGAWLPECPNCGSKTDPKIVPTSPVQSPSDTAVQVALEQVAWIAREVVARLDAHGAPFPLATSIDKLRKPLAVLDPESDE